MREQMNGVLKYAAWNLTGNDMIVDAVVQANSMTFSKFFMRQRPSQRIERCPAILLKLSFQKQ